jgi:hypothetical protein
MVACYAAKEMMALDTIRTSYTCTSYADEYLNWLKPAVMRQMRAIACFLASCAAHRFCSWRCWTVLSMWLLFLMLLLRLGYVAPMRVSLACTLWCFYGFNYAIAYACLHDTIMLASMIYL